MFAKNIFFGWRKACYPYIFLRLQAYEKLWDSVGRHIQLRSFLDMSCSMLSPPLHLALSEFNSVELKLPYAYTSLLALTFLSISGL
jgi:hypothetical protein